MAYRECPNAPRCTRSVISGSSIETRRAAAWNWIVNGGPSGILRTGMTKVFPELGGVRIDYGDASHTQYRLRKVWTISNVDARE